MGWLIMKYIKKGFSVFLSLFIMCTLVFNVHVYAEETTYQYSDTASSNGITLKVEWNEPALGQETTFHVSASGGSGNYKFRMDSPSYSNPDEWSFESVADPSRGQWMQYTDICASHDFSFTMMASGTYDFRFYLMDTEFGLYYLRCQTYINVFDSNFPSLNTIINDAVAKCKTDSEYQTALNLHDWLLQQLEYDNSLKWSSAESALTRGLGTCQAYESAYSRLLSAAGITNSETRDTYDGHTWNAAYLDGEWYQIDCTWDDSVNNYGDFDSQHVYFGLTDELMAIAHKGHTNIYTDSGYGTRSTSLVDNYFVKNGKAQEWANNYKSEIETNIASKLTSFTITASNASQPESISGIQNGIIAYVINSMDWSTNSTKVTLSCVGESKQFVFTVSYQEKCTNHTWSEGIITTSPTCTEKGVKTFTCTTCGTTKTEEVTALGHDYSTEWTTDVEATCTTEGSKSHHCTRDGCSAKTGDTSIQKTNHEYSSEWTIDKEATCQEEGSKSHHCIHCDEKTDVTTISKTDHHWDSGTVTKAATCTTTGVKTYTCKTCKTTKAEEIDALGHDYSTDYTVDVEATCTEAGSKSRHCTHDGCNEKIEETSIPAKGHSWNSGVVTKKATYNQNGTIQYTCTKCGTKKNESISSYIEIAKQNRSVISDGNYVIQSSINSNYVLDINNGSTANGANLQLYGSNNTLAQAFRVSHDSNGFVTFTNLKSGKVLDVSDGIARNGKNVWQYGTNGTRAQKWIVKKNGNGYIIVSALDTNFVLDLSDGVVRNGKNIHIYTSNGTNAQKWYLSRYMTKEEKLNAFANTNRGVISDGTYVIQSSLNSNYVLDVSNGSTANAANIQLYSANNTLAQAFKVTHDSNGYVTFTNVKSGKVLDVSDGIARNGKNVWQYGSNNTRAQKWIVKKNGNGYTIVSAIDSNYVLDLSDGIVRNSKNIHIYSANGTNAQKWYFKKK